MGSADHVKDDKMDLVHDVHRLTQLGVQLVDSNEGVVVVHNGAKSSFISDVKAKKDLDSILVDLKKMVSKKELRLTPKGEMVLLYTMVSYML